MRLLLLLLTLPVTMAVSIDTIDVTGTGSLVSNSSALFTCNATLHDDDGYGEIISSGAALFHESSTYANPDDNNSHYTGSCESQGSGNELNLTCSFYVWYYALPGSWNCTVTASDGISASASDSMAIDELTAFHVSSLSYPEAALNAVSDQAAMQIENLGNTDLNFSVSGSVLSCQSGMISVGYQHYSLSSGFSYPLGLILTGTPEPIDSFEVGKRTGTREFSYLYWLLKIPAQGAGGFCTGTIDLEAR